MDKQAQKRGLLTRLHDWGNLSGKAQEKLFNPEFEKVMDDLRTVDNDVRSIVAGESIDGGEPGGDSVSMKELLKESKKNFNRREYMTAVAFLGRFHKKANDAVNKLESLHINVNKIHEDFLFKDLDEDYKKDLRDLRNRFSNIVYRESMFVNAGMKDMLVNVFTDRGRALAAWEKKYPKQVKKLKKDTQNLLSKSENLLQSFLNSLKLMGTFRAARNPDLYLKEISKISSLFKKYHDLFVIYYNENIKGFLDNQDFASMPEVPSEPEVTIEDDAVSSAPIAMKFPVIEPLDVPQKTNIPSLPDTRKSLLAPDDIALRDTIESVKAPEVKQTENTSAPVPPKGMETILELEEDPDDFSGLFDQLPSDKKAHKNFLLQLQILSNESPQLLANHIKKYAASIEKTDSVIASRLNNLASKIIRNV